MDERRKTPPAWYERPDGYYPRVMVADDLARLLLAEAPAFLLRAETWWYWTDGPHTDTAHLRETTCHSTDPSWWEPKPGRARAVEITGDEAPAGYVLCHHCARALIMALRLDVPRHFFLRGVGQTA